MWRLSGDFRVWWLASSFRQPHRRILSRMIWRVLLDPIDEVRLDSGIILSLVPLEGTVPTPSAPDNGYSFFTEFFKETSVRDKPQERRKCVWTTVTVHELLLGFCDHWRFVERPYLNPGDEFSLFMSTIEMYSWHVVPCILTLYYFYKWKDVCPSTSGRTLSVYMRERGGGGRGECGLRSAISVVIHT